jgi:Ras-related protein Rap-1B
MHSIELSLVDRRIILEILDTAGIDEFPVMRRIAIAHGDAFLILYAVNDAHSFDIAQQMYELVHEIKTDSTNSIPMVIVANKSDLDRNKREITREYAESIVRDQWKTTHIETTCQERESVLNTFRILLQLANINTTFSPDVTRRSSDPSLSSNRGQRTTNKRQSCAQQ